MFYDSILESCNFIRSIITSAIYRGSLYFWILFLNHWVTVINKRNFPDSVHEQKSHSPHLLKNSMNWTCIESILYVRHCGNLYSVVLIANVPGIYSYLVSMWTLACSYSIYHMLIWLSNPSEACQCRVSKFHSHRVLGIDPNHKDEDPRASYKDSNVYLQKCQKNISLCLSKAGSTIV